RSRNEESAMRTQTSVRLQVPVGVFTLLLLASVACGGLPLPSGLGGPTPTPAPPEATVSADQVTTFGSGPFELADPRIGLADLSSYTATLTMSFDGTKDGNAYQWSKTYVMIVNKDPAARQLTIQKSGSLTSIDEVNMAESGGVAYTWKPD